MLNRYFALTLGIVTVAIAAFFVVAVLLFTQGLREVRTCTDERMLFVARHAAEGIEDMLPASASDDIGEWLSSLAEYAGFERIVVVDTLSLVMWTSNEFIYRGDDFEPYLVDTTAFRRAVGRQDAEFSAETVIDDVPFKSFYYYCSIEGDACIVAVEADRSYFSKAALFRNRATITGVILLGVFLFLGVLLALVNRRFRQAHAQAVRNERLAFLGRTSAELAHELKNPLAIMKTSCDLLREQHDPGKKEKAFDYLSDEVMRLSRLINDMLAFSRDKQLARVTFNPREVVDRVAVGVRDTWPEVVVGNSLPESLSLMGDPDAFFQIAGNLMRNAASAQQGKGSIRVTSSERGKRLCLAFSDNGSGIEADLARSIFEPFASGSKTGTGLGLAIVKSLCEASGWKIKLASRVAGNTVFEVLVEDRLWERS